MEKNHHSGVTVGVLGERYREAWLVASRVPSGLNLGHASYWPEFNPNRWEVHHSEGVQTKSTPPSGDTVDRMIECMRWLRWLSEEERELVWLRASGLPWRDIAKESGLSRMTASRHWRKALMQVILRLNQ